MRRNLILAGTGFDNRASIIRRYCQNGMKALLRREPNNPYDPNAIAVFIEIPRLFGLLDHSLRQIGHIKAATAKSLAKRMDEGFEIQARGASLYAPSDRDYPKVTLEIDYVKSL